MKFSNNLLFSLCLMLFFGCGTLRYAPVEQKVQYVAIKDSIPHNPQLDSFLAPYHTKMVKNMAEIIGRTEVTLTAAQPESNLGNFIADAQLITAKNIEPRTQISVFNFGGIRVPFIGKGDITKGKIYELMPFDNMLTIVEVPGSVLQQFCDHMIKRKAWPIAGFTYVIKDGNAVDIKVNGEPIKEHFIYRMATNDYLANGGDDCYFLSSLKRTNTGLFIRDVIMEQIRTESSNGKGISPKVENRIVYAD